jgi:di/tricarboxylate transporter
MVVILLGAAAGWLLTPVPEFVVALLMAAAWGMAGVAPVGVVFGGFASSVWVILLAAAGLAAAMANSGLLFRASLLVLKLFPATHAGQASGLVLAGVAATPLIPSAPARVAFAGGLIRELVQTVEYAPRSNASAGLAAAALAGYGYFSAIFLTGFAPNFILLTLLPEPDRIGWLTWLAFSWPTGVILALGLAGLLLVFRPEKPMRKVREALSREEHTLGPLSRREWVTLGATVIFVGGLVGQTQLKVDGVWLALGALGALFVGGALDRDTYQRSIDWGFLTFIGVLIGVGDVQHHAQVDTWLGASLAPLAHSVSHPVMLLTMLMLLAVVFRLVLPSLPLRLLLMTAALPIAPSVGIAPWLAGFVVLIVSEPSLIPAQDIVQRVMNAETEGEVITPRQQLRFSIGITVILFVAVVLSIPYWYAIGLIRS